MNYKTTKYTFSAGVDIDNPKIKKAKQYMYEKYKNKYNADPHVNFIISAMPKYRINNLENELDKYFISISSFKLYLGSLHYEVKEKLFSIPIVNNEVMQIHQDLLKLANKIRDNYIREKDLRRMNEGKSDEKSIEYITKYGYLRVLDRFIPHITIGNINCEQYDLKSITNDLNDILASVVNSEIIVDKFSAQLIVDADIQSDYKFLWKKDFFIGKKTESI